MGKQETLAELRATRARLLAAIGDLPPDAVDSPGVAGEWSVKEVVAHILAWEEETVQRLELIDAGRDGEIRYFQAEEIDAWNAQAVGARMGLSWSEMLAALAGTRERLVAILERMSDERLAAPTGRVPIAHWLPVFTYGHEQEHLPQLLAWRERLGGTA